MKIGEYLATGVSYVVKPSKRKLIRIASSLASKVGLEVGGPSTFFRVRGGFPVYVFAKIIDGVNFSNETVWEGEIKEGLTYEYAAGKLGMQFIREATDLSGIEQNKYDFVLSCHSLEHVANPIKALMEWNRILKAGGQMVLVLPDKENTFDKQRPYSTFQHLHDDYLNDVDEHDTTHFDEIIQFHDSSRDPGLKDAAKLREVLNDNFTNRQAHHHVFNFDLITKMLEFSGFEVSYQTKMDPFHLITTALKK